MDLGTFNAVIFLQNGAKERHVLSGKNIRLARNLLLSSILRLRKEHCQTQECSTLTNLLEHGSLSSLSRLGTEHHGIDVED
jgi:hypothetical protein